MNGLKVVPESGLMNVKDVAKYLNVPVSTIYNLTFREAIPHFHVGKSLRFKRENIDRWLECNNG